MLSWKPVWKGKTFCAPGCGRGCTRAEYKYAADCARSLALSMGKGWKPKVWENLGWHWSAEKGGLKLHPIYVGGRVTGYTAYLGEPNSAGGRWASYGRKPASAIRNVIREAKRDVAPLLAILRETSEGEGLRP